MIFVNLPTIYESIPHIKGNVALVAVDPLSNEVFEFRSMAPYPVFTYGLNGHYVDGYQLVDTHGNNHYLPASNVAGVDFRQGKTQ